VTKRCRCCFLRRSPHVAALGLLLVLLSLLTACGDRNDECCSATIRITVPEGTGNVYLSGSLDALGPWAPDALLMSGTGVERSATVTAPSGTALEYKFTLGSWEREALGPSGTVMANFSLQLDDDVEVHHELADFRKDPTAYIDDWQGSGVEGRLVYWTDVESDYLEAARHVEVWLPPRYDDNADARYAVLYMHDGQNLFDPRVANTGIDWGVDETIVRLVNEGAIPPLIAVGVWSSSSRGAEYSPWHGAEAYARFLIEELMPRVNEQFRTLTGPQNTAVMGSSIGGLLSYYLVTTHPDVFGACGCMSTHFPLSEASANRYILFGEVSDTDDATPYILRDIESGKSVPDDVRYWFDYGTEGLDASYGPTHEAVRAWLLLQGKTEGDDFVVREYPGAEHNEASWRARLDDPLKFLFARY
jgi:predicted alpha/beta superfamily hydrolase